MTSTSTKSRSFLRGFSLVEMMACVSIIGIIAFMAIPSVTRMRGDSERNLVIARAESLNLAMASFIQVRGRTQASLDWVAAASDANRYTLLRPYLSFAEDKLSAYLPSGYEVKFPLSITSMTKVTLSSNATGPIYY